MGCGIADGRYLEEADDAGLVDVVGLDAGGPQRRGRGEQEERGGGGAAGGEDVRRPVHG